MVGKDSRRGLSEDSLHQTNSSSYRWTVLCAVYTASTRYGFVGFILMEKKKEGMESAVCDGRVRQSDFLGLQRRVDAIRTAPRPLPGHRVAEYWRLFWDAL